MLIDSNLIIYATQPDHTRLQHWLVENATHYSIISRLETLGYHRLNRAEAALIHAILDHLMELTMDDEVIERAIGLRQQRKMSLGDALVAATALVHRLPLATANGKDFSWIEALTVENPLE